MAQHYCAECQVAHASPVWYGGGHGGAHSEWICRKAYRKLLRRHGDEDFPRAPRGSCVGWIRCLQKIDDVDHTGHWIVSSFWRPDVQAMRLARHILTQQGGGFELTEVVVYFSGFVYLLYWSWPIMSFLATVMRNDVEIAVTDHVIRAAYKSTVKLFSPFKVLRGDLVPAKAGGLKVVGRDKDRGWSSKRLLLLLQERVAWRKVCGTIASALEENTISVAAIMGSLEDVGMKAYTGAKSSYASIGWVRVLAIMFNRKFIDCQLDWKYFRGMSCNIGEKLSALGLFEYDAAIACRNALRQKLRQPKYSLTDLIVYVCLMKR